MNRTSIRDFLYEPPGPKTRRAAAIGTAAAIAGLILLLVLIIRQFYISGQLDSRYWYFFGKWSTWRFLGEGLLTTIRAALTGSALSFLLGFLLLAWGCGLGKKRPLPIRFLPGLAGLLLCHLLGALWYARIAGLAFTASAAFGALTVYA